MVQSRPFTTAAAVLTVSVHIALNGFTANEPGAVDAIATPPELAAIRNNLAARVNAAEVALHEAMDGADNEIVATPPALREIRQTLAHQVAVAEAALGRVAAPDAAAALSPHLQAAVQEAVAAVEEIIGDASRGLDGP